MSKIDVILAGLEKVRPTAPGEWVACCPAHEDRSPSLAIKDTGDGRILIHCFAGCPVEHILAVLGLKLADLMPEKRLGPVEGLKRLPWNPRTVLEAVAFNVTAIAIAAADMAHGKLEPKDADRVIDLAAEILEAVKYATR